MEVTTSLPTVTAPIAQAVEGEVPLVPAEEPKKEEPKYSKQFAAIVAQKRALRREQERVKAESAEVKEYREHKKNAKANPLAYLGASGLDYQQLTEYVLNDSKPTPEMQIKALEERLEADRAERAKEREESQTKQTQAVIENHKKQIQQFVDSKNEEFELIQVNQAYDTVLDVIEAYWKRTGKIISIEDAAKHVEEEFETQAKKLLGLKKFAVKSAPEVSQSPQEAPKSMSSPRTLTHAATSAAATPSSTAYLSREESIRRAAQMLKGG